jgi:integrase/very-short-patch-repair endonuclease
LLLVLAWYKQIFVALPEHQAHAEPYRRLVFTARLDRLKAIKANAGTVQEHRAALDQIAAKVAEFVRRVPSQRLLMASGSFQEILGSIQKLTLALESVLPAIDSAAIQENLSLRDIPNILTVAGQCRKVRIAIEAMTELPALLGANYRGVNSDIEPVRRTVEVADSIASGSLPSKTAERLLCPEYTSRLAELRSMLHGAHDCGERIQVIGQGLTAISGSAMWSDNPDSAWGGLQALAGHALANQLELSRWSHFLRLRIQSKDGGLDKLTALAESRILRPDELVPAFHFVFYNTLARSVFTEHAELSQVTGVTQELLRQQFAEADREAIRLYSERVASLIDQRSVPYENQSGPVRTWSDMALIMNEINKQKRHIPIRQLIRRAANALVAVKPCFMMGPLSVAQYLAPGQLKFDLIVMDEASQLKPEDAIGAIARGGQGVIVLKQYLIYARTGVLQQAEEEGDQPTNDFERSVGTVLKEKGYHVVPQVGVAGFFVDLGVKHPAKLGAFLLGIECDGAGYHSGRSARDRDRLRQEILENLGWKIHRIWSTDWFKNRDSEIKRLLRRLEEILESDPAYQREKAKTNKAEALRRRLIKLRDEEIRPAHPDTPADRCLLSPNLLEERNNVRRKRYQEGSLQQRKQGKRKVWAVLYRVAGIRKYYTLGPCSKMNKSQAQEKQAEFMKEVNVRAAATPDPNITFGDFLEGIALPFYRSKWKISTASTTEGRIRHHLLREFKEKKFQNLTVKTLQAFLNGKAATRSKSIVAHLRWDLRAIFRLGVAEGYIERDPTHALFTPKEAKTGIACVMTGKEAKQYIEALDLRERVVDHLALFVGMRPGEILGLQRLHIADDCTSLVIEQRLYRGDIDDPKTRTSKRNVGIPSQTARELLEWMPNVGPEPEAWVFASENPAKPMWRDNLWYRNMKPRLEAVGLGWANFQVLRRTHASLGHELKVDPKVAADQRGHGIGVALDVYTKSSIEARPGAAEMLERAILSGNAEPVRELPAKKKRSAAA